MTPVVYIGSDHEGFKLKAQLLDYLADQPLLAIDVGCASEEPVDYPDIAAKVAGPVSHHPDEIRGIVICGTGIGVSMAANRFAHVRAGQVSDTDSAKRSREDDDLNVLCLAGASLSAEQAQEIVKVWLATPFSGAERHVRRLSQLDTIATKRE